MNQLLHSTPDGRRRNLLSILCLVSLTSLSAPAQAQPRTETAVLAGGCFWGVQSLYEHVKGVREAVSGFAGGSSSGLTRSSEDGGDPAEAVRITYDPSQISYEQLLQIFFDVAHDPTQLNRQGPDVGPRYRSAIFPQNSQQKEIAQQYLAKLRSSGQFHGTIMTRIESGTFERAEADQQDFVQKHPSLPYVVVNDLPKLQELKQRYPQFWRA